MGWFIGPTAMAIYAGVSAATAIGTGIYSFVQQQSVANYNAQIQAQNAAIQYQMQTQQAQYAAAQAQLNYQLAVSNQAIQGRNQQFALVQAQYAQQKYNLQLQMAKQLENESEAVRGRQREEARRIREEGGRRQAQIVAKYGGSGVLVTEGSPLVVLADEARLTETQVQDATYVAELESRKKLYGAEVQRFEAQFTLLEKAGFEGEAFNARMAEYGAVLQQANATNEIAFQNYGAKIAGVQYNMGLRQADLIRYEGNVRATTGLISSAGDAFSGIASYGSTSGMFTRNTFTNPPRAGAVNVPWSNQLAAAFG